MNPSRRPLAPALLALALAAAACQRAPVPPRLLVLGPQVTCVTGPKPVCAGDCTFQIPADLSTLTAAHAVTFGLRHGCMLDAAGRVSCWGDASEGQQGVDPAAVSGRCRGRPCRTVPTAVPGAPSLRTIEAGWLHTCGLSAAGAVVCWGDDTLDQLGRSAPGSGPEPVEGLPPGVTQVSAGAIHTCAVTGDGAVYCWGDGSEGQLGQMVAVDSPRPVAVQGLPGPVTEVAAGGYHTCALLADGAVSCWGQNRWGQLGDGTRTSRSMAGPVAGLAGPARSLAVGAAYTCALLRSGAVQCWGSNEMGELGQGFDDRPPAPGEPAAPPATVERLGEDVVSLRAGAHHACAERGDGSILCWGANELGQIGDGTLVGRDVPFPWLGRNAARPGPRLAELGPGPVEGLDVSYHSGRVDWTAAVAHGHRFALTLATSGDDFRDPFFISHWERMRQAGLLRGAYHFFEPDDDPEIQARTFLSQVVLEPGDLAPVVDIETRGSPAPDDLPERLRTFVDIVEKAVGAKPIIYTGPTFWNQNMNREFGDYPLWISEYGVPEPHVPAGWKAWQLWQWRGDADLPDVAPVVDLDRLSPGTDLETLVVPGGESG